MFRMSDEQKLGLHICCTIKSRGDLFIPVNNGNARGLRFPACTAHAHPVLVSREIWITAHGWVACGGFLTIRPGVQVQTQLGCFQGTCTRRPSL